MAVKIARPRGPMLAPIDIKYLLPAAYDRQYSRLLTSILTLWLAVSSCECQRERRRPQRAPLADVRESYYFCGSFAGKRVEAAVPCGAAGSELLSATRWMYGIRGVTSNGIFSRACSSGTG